MASRIIADLLATLKSSFRINKGTIDAGGLTAARIFTLSDVTSTISAVLNRSTSTTTIVNDSAEQTLYSQSIAANLLSTNRMLRLTIFGSYLNNSGSNKTAQLKVKFGSTTLFDDVTAGLITGATDRPFFLQCWLANKGATNSQLLVGNFWMGRPAPPTSGIGDLGAQMSTDNQSVVAPLGGTATEDTTAAKTLSVTVQHSAAASTVSVSLLSAFLELI